MLIIIIIITIPAGYYCPQSPVIGTPTVEYICPRGYYCPEGTEYGTQYGCDGGTYGVKQGADKQDDCYDCPAGRYCPLGKKVPSICHIE